MRPHTLASLRDALSLEERVPVVSLRATDRLRDAFPPGTMGSGLLLPEKHHARHAKEEPNRPRLPTGRCARGAFPRAQTIRVPTTCPQYRSRIAFCTPGHNVETPAARFPEGTQRPSRRLSAVTPPEHIHLTVHPGRGASTRSHSTQMTHNPRTRQTALGPWRRLRRTGFGKLKTGS